MLVTQDYYDIDRVSASRLNLVKSLIAGESIHRVKKETLAFGNHVHTYLLEYEKYIKANSWHEKVKGMGESAKKNAVLAYLLNCPAAKMEQEVFFTHERTGQLCKLKADIILGACGYDLKTTAFRTLAEFETALIKYGYHRQAAFYMLGAKLKKFTFIAICKTYPYQTFTFSMDASDDRIIGGHLENEILLDQHLKLVRSGTDFKNLMKAA